MSEKMGFVWWKSETVWFLVRGETDIQYMHNIIESSGCCPKYFIIQCKCLKMQYQVIFNIIIGHYRVRQRD